MKQHVAYFKAVMRHKWFVFLACFRFGVPIWSAILHDWDKFLPDEWFAYARTFYKPNGEKQYIESVDFARAWMLHQHRNKHHWQWWMWVTHVTENWGEPLRKTEYIVWDRGEAQRVFKSNSRFVLRPQYEGDYVGDPDPMSDSARREMLADWFGAGRAYNENWTLEEPLKWYEKNKENIQLHPETRVLVEAELNRAKNEYDLDMKRRVLGL